MFSRRHFILLAAQLLAACTPLARSPVPTDTRSSTMNPTVVPEPTIPLPPPVQQGRMSLEAALARRRSVREYSEERLTPVELGQLLWAAQGITSPEGFRTAPSAGARYPLELYAVVPEAVYHYNPQRHLLALHLSGDRRPDLYTAALHQESVLRAPVVIVMAAVYQRTASRYGRERTPRYVHMEIGHAAQNVLLQAVALGLGGVPIGAFYDDQVQRALALPADHAPLYLIPVGRPRPARD